MKKPALREKRSKSKVFNETNWTKSSKTVGQYIFRRLSLDQSDKELSRIRPRHCQSQLIVSSKEIDMYVSDYLSMVDRKKKESTRQNGNWSKARSSTNGKQSNVIARC